MLDYDPFQATEPKSYDGNAVAILRAKSSKGRITVTATVDGVPPASISLKLAPIHPLSSERSF